jgi:hypothetical protein
VLPQSRPFTSVVPNVALPTVKKGVDGNVSALWPGSSLHYMQTLAEDRWNDYTWKYRGNRFDHWGSGFSWIEHPELDPLGIALADSRHNMRTVPHKGADLSFYLAEAAPLPQQAEPLPAQSDLSIIKADSLPEVHHSLRVEGVSV